MKADPDDKYRLESQSVSYTYILYCTVAILLAVAVFPFLKLHVSSPYERLRRSDVIGAAIFACFAASTIAFILLDIYHWQKHFSDPADEDMKACEGHRREFRRRKETSILAVG